uniref:RNase H type-1 domain-containing protein n=1 Tax=Tanacetum cinerariifolium TaxID=118510 RepID=A0A6L2LS21_TANCI|nr:hypothetical protein [Tanacetum cinerariifolium]
MYVDFSDINKAFPKDCYPLPEIHWKVESLSRFWLKCFLDAYKGYHQIQMAEEDEDKKTFFAGEGTFCYRKMPFGLKNTEEAEEAFQKMKKFMEIFPTLTAPIKGEVLVMYLAALTESISAVQFAEREGEQIPVYFVNMVLQEPELNYPTLEKVILALIHVARRLRRTSTNTSLVRCSKVIEETKTENNAWRLYTDGASSSDGSGARLMLISPEGKEYTYALRFEFQATNNKAEYEALMAWLRIAQEMEIRSLAIFAYS